MTFLKQLSNKKILINNTNHIYHTLTNKKIYMPKTNNICKFINNINNKKK